MAAHLDTIVERAAGLDQFVASYRPLPGIFDEMMDGDGRVRAHWRPFLSMLAGLGAEEISRRFAAAADRADQETLGLHPQTWFAGQKTENLDQCR